MVDRLEASFVGAVLICLSRSDHYRTYADEPEEHGEWRKPWILPRIASIWEVAIDSASKYPIESGKC